MYEQLKNNPLAELKSLQLNIVGKLEKLSDLNQEYRSKQEKQFLAIFLNVMDKMSSELSLAKEQYENIDRDIEKDEKCVQLSTKLCFFRNQCCFLKQELEKTQQEIKSEKQKQKNMIKQKQLLQSDLFEKSKQIQKYKIKARSLDKKIRSQTVVDIFEKHDALPGKTEDNNSKKHSLSQTKNTKLSFFTCAEPTAESPRNLKTSEAEFRIKAAKMAKQRKILMNKTYYSFSSTTKNKIRPQTQGILR